MTVSPHSPHTLFVDRNTGGRNLRAAVAAAGISIVLHDEVYPAQAGVTIPDHQWLLEVGQKGWLLVTGDAHTMKEALFIRRIPESKAFVFILHDLNGGTPAERAKCIIDAYPKMLGLIGHATRPEVWLFKNGKIKLVPWRDTLKRILQHDERMAAKRAGTDAEAATLPSEAPATDSQDPEGSRR